MRAPKNEPSRDKRKRSLDGEENHGGTRPRTGPTQTSTMARFGDEDAGSKPTSVDARGNRGVEVKAPHKHKKPRKLPPVLGDEDGAPSAKAASDRTARLMAILKAGAAGGDARGSQDKKKRFSMA